jgi:hypothetical protein
MPNTHPNTPFGKFFYSVGIWHPDLEDGIKAAYDTLHDTEKEAVKTASAWIAVINSSLYLAPDAVFELLAQKFPGITKEKLTAFLNNLNSQIAQADRNVPDDFGAAMEKMQSYLATYEGHSWAAITRAVVEIGAVILSGGKLDISLVGTILEYVYQTFIKLQ